MLVSGSLPPGAVDIVWPWDPVKVEDVCAPGHFPGGSLKSRRKPFRPGLLHQQGSRVGPQVMKGRPPPRSTQENQRARAGRGAARRGAAQQPGCGPLLVDSSFTEMQFTRHVVHPHISRASQWFLAYSQLCSHRHSQC